MGRGRAVWLTFVPAPLGACPADVGGPGQAAGQLQGAAAAGGGRAVGERGERGPAEAEEGLAGEGGGTGWPRAVPRIKCVPRRFAASFFPIISPNCSVRWGGSTNKV